MNYVYPVPDDPPVMRVVIDGRQTDIPVTIWQLYDLAERCIRTANETRWRKCENTPTD